MTSAWAVVGSAVVTGVLAFFAQAWAKRGQPAVDLNSMAMGMVEELKGRVERLENVESWRALCAVIDADHIGVLRDHIYRQLPPPPPARPVYPARPV